MCSRASANPSRLEPGLAAQIVDLPLQRHDALDQAYEDAPELRVLAPRDVNA